MKRKPFFRRFLFCSFFVKRKQKSVENPDNSSNFVENGKKIKKLQKIFQKGIYKIDFMW